MGDDEASVVGGAAVGLVIGIDWCRKGSHGLIRGFQLSGVTESLVGFCVVGAALGVLVVLVLATTEKGSKASHQP